MNIRNLFLYYWSGTGNTLKISQWISELADARNISTKVQSIGKANPKEEIIHSKENMIGILAPVHGFTAPWPMIKFCISLPRGNGMRSIVVTNRGGAYPGFYLRGLSASTGFIIALLVLIKGYRIRGLISIDMPSNWTAVVPGMNDEHNHRFINRARDKTTAFFEKILIRRHIFSADNLFEFTWGIALAPISFLYIILGRFFLAKLFFANIDCTSCGICKKNCPHHAIIMKGAEKKIPYWTFNCESCGRCINYCPEKAIEAGHSVGIALYFGTTIPVSFYALNWLVKYFPWVSNLQNEYIRFFLDYPFKLLGIFLISFILHYLMRFRIINLFFSYTAGTHWYRRYHEPDIKLKDYR